MVPPTITPNSVPSVGSVPALASTRFCFASEPASTSTARIGTNRPNSIAKPSVTWKKSLVTVSPPNALPLLLDADA